MTVRKFASRDGSDKVPIAELPTGTSGTTVALGNAVSGAVTTHEAAGDPHTGYRLESADHSHASAGLQGGTVAHSALTGIAATDHHAAPAAGPDANVTIDGAGAAGTASTFARSGHGHRADTYASTPAAIGTGAPGTSATVPSRGNHVHATGAGTPTTQAFGDAAAIGTGPAAAMTDHRHGMPASPSGGGDLVFVDTPDDVAINSITDVTVNTRDVTGVAAGDQLIVDAWFTILNNSAATRIVTLTLDFDGAFDIEFATGALAVSATLMHPIHLYGVLDVRSSSLAYAMLSMDMQLLAGIASGTDTTAAATHLQAKGWGTSGGNLTGTVTVALLARSANATATQTLRLHSHTIRKVTPT